MATVTVDQAKLVLNSFAAIFENNLVSADLVTWRKFDGELNDRNGLTVVEQVTPDYYTTWQNDGLVDLTAGVQNTDFGSEQFRLRRTLNSSMGWTDFQKIKDLGSARESQALRKAALRLAADIDSYVLAYLTNVSNNWLGDGTSAVSEYEDVASGYTRLKEMGVDDDSNFRAVLSYPDRQALGTEVVDPGNAALTNIADGIYRNGWGGSIDGIPTLFTQQLPTLTTGSRTAGALNYATGTPVNQYVDVSRSPAPGQFKTGLLNIDGVGTTNTVREGETFTIAGVWAWDPIAKKRLGFLQEFRVVGGTNGNGINDGVYTAAAGAITNLRYYPAIIVDSPYKTVDVASGFAWNDAVITFKGAANAVLQPRVIANKEAVIINTVNLPMPVTGKANMVNLNKVPISVRMWQDSKFDTSEQRIRFDVALEANVTADGRKRVVRING